MSNNDINSSLGRLLLRLTVAGLMLLHGAAKIMHPGSLEHIGASLSTAGLPSFIAYGVFVGEVIAPLLIIIGLYTRVGGLLIVANMLFAIALSHPDAIFMLSKHGGWAIELQALYLLGGLTIALLGSGKYAIKPD
jgi:putative oxidoreductase